MNKYLALLLLIPCVLLTGCMTTIEPGERGVKVELGKVDPVLKKEGVELYNPFTTRVEEFIVRQTTRNIKTQITTKDLQEVTATIAVTYKVPDDSVIKIFSEYDGDAFDKLVQPRTLEGLKSVASHYTAAEFVQKRDEIKEKAKLKADASLRGLVDVSELLITDTKFSPELEKAIERKQVKQEEAKAAQYTLEKSKLEAEATKVAGQAITQNPVLLKQKWIEKWDGHLPKVVTDDSAMVMIDSK